MSFGSEESSYGENVFGTATLPTTPKVSVTVSNWLAIGDAQRKEKSNKVKLVVWNKDRKKWLKNERFSHPDDYTFFRIKVPTADDLKQKEQGAKESRCPPDSISNSSKSIKKGRRVQSLKHIDYKKFLQCYIHIQELKRNPEASAVARRKRVKNGPKSTKPPRMVSTGIEYANVEHHPLSAGFGQFETQGLLDSEHAFTVDLSGIDDVANFEQVDLVDTFQVTSSPPRRNEYGNTEISFDKDGKPRCTYTDLIERALSESGGLTVSEIYQWISDHYPFFRPDDDRWKNSVRHNLSINPYFKKGEKARSGAGHLWTISEESRALRPSFMDMQRRKEMDTEELSMLIKNETDRAVANILGQYQVAKNNMEGKGQKSSFDSDLLCTPPLPQMNSNASLNQETAENVDKLMENAPVIIEYENNVFPGAEYTIDLSQFQFPDAAGLCFDDLMPGGSLIVIQTDEQEANKENVHNEQSDSVNNTEYLMPEFSNERQDSLITETERVSGQLISESLTHDFEMHKDKYDHLQVQIEQNCRDDLLQTQPMIHDEESQLQQLENSTHHDVQEYLTLDSIDHLALQEVIQGSNNELGVCQYQMMTSDAEYCNFAPTEVNH